MAPLGAVSNRFNFLNFIIIIIIIIICLIISEDSLLGGKNGSSTRTFNKQTRDGILNIPSSLMLEWAQSNKKIKI